MIGSDDVLACFIAGNIFTIEYTFRSFAHKTYLPSTSDWFRLETLDDSLQPTIDMLLNLSVFMWFGAVCPWPNFLYNDVVPLYRLVFLGILILLFRRLPVVYAMHWKIQQIEEKQQALFVGFFGPIGVSVSCYLFHCKSVTKQNVRPSLQALRLYTVSVCLLENSATVSHVAFRSLDQEMRMNQSLSVYVNRLIPRPRQSSRDYATGISHARAMIHH